MSAPHQASGLLPKATPGGGRFRNHDCNHPWGPWKKAIEGLRSFEKVLTSYAVFDEIRELPMFKVPPVM